MTGRTISSTASGRGNSPRLGNVVYRFRPAPGWTAFLLIILVAYLYRIVILNDWLPPKNGYVFLCLFLLLKSLSRGMKFLIARSSPASGTEGSQVKLYGWSRRYHFDFLAVLVISIGAVVDLFSPHPTWLATMVAMLMWFILRANVKLRPHLGDGTVELRPDALFDPTIKSGPIAWKDVASIEALPSEADVRRIRVTFINGKGKSQAKDLSDELMLAPHEAFEMIDRYWRQHTLSVRA